MPAVIYALLVCPFAAIADDAVRVTRSTSSGLPVFAGWSRVPHNQAAAPLGRTGRLDLCAVHFNVADAAAELILVRDEVDALRHRHETYQQMHRGVPVFSGILKVHSDAAGRVVAGSGRYYPIPGDLSVQPQVPGDSANAVAQHHAGLPNAEVFRTSLVIVDPGWYGDPPAGPRLAWHIEIGDEPSAREFAFFVDATDGCVTDVWSLSCSAINRQIYTGIGENQLPGTLIRAEGDPVSGLPSVDIAYDYAGDAYNYFLNAFGRDSYDNAGSAIHISTQAEFTGVFPCPNASWSYLFNRMTLCTGTETDDIIAHEFTHGVTHATADLIYQNQPGQLNESFSDIFGEMVDLFNSGSAFVGETGATPWEQHPTGPGLDMNLARSSCTSSLAGFPDGTRWVQAEDSTAFNFGVRDMWDPVCFMHPNTANHALQTCSALDDGGVHSGSGVLNHAFAIACDGKSFNGYTVAGVGPIKAGAAFYRALTFYLTVGSDFQDAYLAINQAALDLVGTFPADPRTGLASQSMFTAADAASIDQALLAVELNTAGACGEVIPTLDSAPPPVCEQEIVIFADDFEGGAAGWTVENSAPPTPYDWQQVQDLPFDRPGTAWFCEDRLVGDCQTVDETSTHDLVSPSIVVPAAFKTLTLRFTHFVEVEPRFDGGQVHISVNGGEWQLVPTAAFWFNRYNTSLFTADISTNPLAGQITFSGVGGEWGVSLIDLGTLVDGGDSVRFRFRFAKDSCNGYTGWYIDDFVLFDCASSGDCNGNGIFDEADRSAGPAREILLSQLPNNKSTGNLSDADPHPSLGLNLLAENFDLLRPNTVHSLRVWGAYTGNMVVNDDFTIKFHENADGLPGAIISQQTGLNVVRTATGRRFINLDEYRYDIELNQPVSLPAGRYLIQLFNNTTGSSTTWAWERAFYGWIPGVAFLGQSCTDWCYQEVPNMSIELFGGIIGRDRGDLDASGVVDVADVELMVAAVLGTELELDAICAADMTGEGSVDGLDVQPFVDCVMGACP